MIISVTGRHFDIDNDLKTYIVKKLEGFSKYSSKVIESRAIVEYTRGIHKVELVVAADHSMYYGECDDADIRGAVDKAIKKIEAQLRSHKEKVKNRHRKVKSAPTAGEEMPEEIDEIIDEDYLE